VFDEFRYGEGAGGGSRKQGWSTAQSPRVSQRTDRSRLVDDAGAAAVFALGGNGSTLAVTNSFRPVTRGEKPGTIITATLISLAATPAGVIAGTTRQEVGIPLDGIADWIDRTFPAEDELAFVGSLRDVELLVRVAWESPFPETLDERALLNLEDLPDDVAQALANPAKELATCATCRQLCVRDEFVWKEKQLCAWDYHDQVFGKRGPWRQGPYEARHFETVPSCAYVVTPLLDKLGVEEILALNNVEPDAAIALVNALLAHDAARAQMAVRTAVGFSVLRET
jgi:hypothetical protein